MAAPQKCVYGYSMPMTKLYSLSVNGHSVCSVSCETPPNFPCAPVISARWIAGATRHFREDVPVVAVPAPLLVPQNLRQLRLRL